MINLMTHLQIFQMKLVFEDYVRNFQALTGQHGPIQSVPAGTHPSGTIRMGRTPSDGVVNRKLELWSHPNVKILGSAVFPRASATHPTFPAMVLSQFS